MAGSSRHIVPLEEDELEFIEHKLHDQRQTFWSVMRTLLVLGILIPTLAMVSFKLMRPPDNIEFWLHAQKMPDYYYLIAVVALIVIVSLAGYYSYYRTVKKMARDFKERLKVVEQVVILRKVFMRNNQTCHFYLNSRVKMSIEVAPKDYEFYRIGDEINIEYSKYALEYFGYF